MNKPFSLGPTLEMLGISKIEICKFWYDYAKPKLKKNKNKLG